jgi:hypothetical protein
MGEAKLLEPIYNPILDLIADHNVRTIGQICDAVASQGVPAGQVLEAILVLAGIGHVVPVQDQTATRTAKKQTDRLNAHLLDKARGGHEVAFLASPVSGGAVSVGRFPQLFLLARAQGRKQPAEWADHVWKMLQQQGQRLIKDGKPLATDDENLAELRARAEEFAQDQLPILKALQIA